MGVDSTEEALGAANTRLCLVTGFANPAFIMGHKREMRSILPTVSRKLTTLHALAATALACSAFKLCWQLVVCRRLGRHSSDN